MTAYIPGWLLIIYFQRKDSWSLITSGHLNRQAKVPEILCELLWETGHMQSYSISENMNFYTPISVVPSSASSGSSPAPHPAPDSFPPDTSFPSTFTRLIGLGPVSTRPGSIMVGSPEYLSHQSSQWLELAPSMYDKYSTGPTFWGFPQAWDSLPLIQGCGINRLPAWSLMTVTHVWKNVCTMVGDIWQWMRNCVDLEWYTLYVKLGLAVLWNTNSCRTVAKVVSNGV